MYGIVDGSTAQHTVVLKNILPQAGPTDYRADNFAAMEQIQRIIGHAWDKFERGGRGGVGAVVGRAFVESGEETFGVIVLVKGSNSQEFAWVLPTGVAGTLRYTTAETPCWSGTEE